MKALFRATHWLRITRTTHRARMKVSGRRLHLVVVAAYACSLGLIPAQASADPSPVTLTTDTPTIDKGAYADFTATSEDPRQLGVIFVGTQSYQRHSIFTIDSTLFNWCFFDEMGDITKPRTLTVRLYDDPTGVGLPSTTFDPTFSYLPYLAQVQVTLEASPTGCGPWMPSLDQGTVGQPYNSTVANWDFGLYGVSDGSLPPGLTMSENGTITGTPTEPGEFSFTAGFCGEGCEFQEFTIVVNEPNSRPKGGWLSFSLPQPAELPNTL